MSEGPNEGRSAGIHRIAVLTGFSPLVALVVGALSGNVQAGLVIGAGISLGLVLAALTYRRLFA